MNVKRKHHFIPRFILKNFAINNHIFLYRFDKDVVFNASINDAFAVNELNSLTDKDGNIDHNLIEDIFDQCFENNASVSIQKIIDDLKTEMTNGDDFTTDDFVNVLRFCILSSIRIPYVLEKTLHSMQVNLLAMLLFKHYLEHDNFKLPFDCLSIPKGFLYSFLDGFDDMTKMLVDLKLTIYSHNSNNVFFLLPDQYIISFSPNNCHFADKNLKMFFPISSKIVLCFERVERNFSKGLCIIDESQIEKFNIFFASHSYEAIGCEDKNFLDQFILRNKSKLVPLKRYNPNSFFIKEKLQIIGEIVRTIPLHSKLDKIQTQINNLNEFKILSEEEFQTIQKEMDPIYKIPRRPIKF